VGGYSLNLFSGKYKVSAVSVQTDWQEEMNWQARGFYRKGSGFYDPKSQAVFLASGATNKLKALILKNADGAISGTVYDSASNEPIIEGIFLIWVFDEHGFLAKISSTGEMSGLMTGDYIAPGLRPGTYYLLLLLFDPSDNTGEYIWQWYNGVEAQVPLSLFVPKADIPSGAYPVMVGKGETKGINFYIER
jgi:hypothetical protein